ncbi:MAG TPA: cupin domain-containing protein [Hanamia sp.]|nr:cupin domain-containing protein [Hanamia sp.]
MEMREVYSCDKYKVLNVALNVGEKMPLHEATSDAFIICRKGKGLITFSDRIADIFQNETLLIKAHEQHKLEILEDFSASIILENDGKINFINQEMQKRAPAAIY